MTDTREGLIEAMARHKAVHDIWENADSPVGNTELVAWQLFVPEVERELLALESMGYAVVPVEPSEFMEKAGGDALSDVYWAGNSYEADAHDCWQAMLEAAKP